MFLLKDQPPNAMQIGPLHAFYRKHLKKYPPIRAIVLKCVVIAHRINCHFRLVVFAINGIFYKTSGQKRFAARNKLRVHYLTGKSTAAVRIPRVYPARLQQAVAASHKDYAFPEVFVTEIPAAKVIGGSNLVLTGEYTLHQDKLNYAHELFHEEYRGWIEVFPWRKRIHWLFPLTTGRHMPEAALFMDSCGNNYAHWVTEVLTRLVLFCKSPEFDGIPILLNEEMHANMRQSAELIIGDKHPIVYIPSRAVIEVENLFVTSTAGYAPCDPRGKKLANHPQGYFNQNALHALHDHFCAIAAERFKETKKPSKIYLRRNSGSRNLLNSQEIEDAAQKLGFTVMVPENMSFLEQVAMMNAADVILAPAGAALATSIFCKNGAKLCILVQYNPKLSYYYWPNMASSFGVDIAYIFGTPRSMDPQAHFTIPPQDVIDALKDFV